MDVKVKDKQLNFRSRFFRLDFFIILLITSTVYLVIARLSLLLSVGNTNATSVWPPSGIALAVILLYGYRAGPAIFIGAFIANILVLANSAIHPAYYITASMSTAAGNMLEAVIGAYFIRRFTNSENPFNNMKDLFVFILFGSIVSTMVSAAIGVFSFSLISDKWFLFGKLWFTWWLGDAAGVLIVTPLIIMIAKKVSYKIPGEKKIEAVILFSILVASSIVIFRYKYQLEYLMIPILMWIALRFGRLYSAAAVFLVSGAAIFFTINGIGPLSSSISQKSLLYLQTYIGVISIITLCLTILTHERREADKALIASQKQLYDIIEFLPDATFAVDKNGTVIAWNRSIEVLSGISKKMMLDKNNYEYAIPFFGERRPVLIDFIMESDNKSFLETYDFIERKENIITAEHYNIRLKKYFSAAASRLIDSDGNVFGAIESIRDISDRKTAEQELKHYKEHLEEIIEERSVELLRANEELFKRIEERDKVEIALVVSEKKYRDLVESANSVILRWKPDGTVTFFNTYAQNFFGFDESEIIGKNVVGSIVPVMESSGRDLSLMMDDIQKNPEAHVFNENENIRKNGEKVWIVWTNKPVFNSSGELIEILSVGNDITERKKMEVELRKTLNELAIAKDQAEAADRLKSAFLATMSHELRTPLNSIIGFTGIILQGLAGPLNKEQEKQLGMVRGSARHLLSLITDVLDISKIEAGQFVVHAESFNLKSVIEKAAAALKPAADKKKIKLNIAISDDLDEVVSDKRRVEQIIINLLSNAIKFTERGSVTLAANIIRDYYLKGDLESNPVPAVECRFSDTGIGIQPEDLCELFQPFRQIDTGLSRKNEGTGLGLAISRRLAELLGGEIKAESGQQCGSVFTFIMPAGKGIDK